MANWPTTLTPGTTLTDTHYNSVVTGLHNYPVGADAVNCNGVGFTNVGFINLLGSLNVTTVTLNPPSGNTNFVFQRNSVTKWSLVTQSSDDAFAIGQGSGGTVKFLLDTTGNLSVTGYVSAIGLVAVTGPGLGTTGPTSVQTSFTASHPTGANLDVFRLYSMRFNTTTSAWDSAEWRLGRLVDTTQMAEIGWQGNELVFYTASVERFRINIGGTCVHANGTKTTMGTYNPLFHALPGGIWNTQSLQYTNSAGYGAAVFASSWAGNDTIMFWIGSLNGVSYSGTFKSWFEVHGAGQIVTPNLTNYADRNAAITAGLYAGCWYRRTSDGALMVV